MKHDLKHSVTPGASRREMELVTPRLLLRELRPDDWPALYHFESDPDAVRWQSYDVRTEEECREYIARAVEDGAANPRTTYELAVTRLDGGDTMIGRVALHLAKPEAGEAAIWYILTPSEHGRGFATEAMRAVVDFGFARLELHRIWADIDPRNAASRRVLEKLGFRCEAHHIENEFLKGEWCDTEIHALLAREWVQAREG